MALRVKAITGFLIVFATLLAMSAEVSAAGRRGNSKYVSNRYVSNTQSAAPSSATQASPQKTYIPAPQTRRYSSGGAFKQTNKPAWGLQKTHPQKYSTRR